MTRRVFYGQNDIRYYYNRYKDSKYYSISIFVLVIIVCIVLLLGVMTPLFNNYLSIRSEVAAKQAQIKTMNENIVFINNMDRSALNNQLVIATQALPAEKDFEGLLSAITNSSISSGVTLSDFNFRIGDISPKSTKDASSSAAPQNISPDSVISSDKISSSIDLVITIDGDIEQVKLFLKQISEKLPLSVVTTIDKDNNKTEVVIEFYYKPYPEISFQEDVLLVPLSTEKARLIEKLATWKGSASEEVILPVGTNSAVRLFE